MGKKTAKSWADERFAEDAPRHMSADHAYGWACGYNAAVAKSAQADLLEALTRLVRIETDHGDPTGPEWDAARAVIAKATGEAS